MMEMEGGVPRIERGLVMLRERGGGRCELCTEKGLQKGTKKRKKDMNESFHHFSAL